jgi:hypothetical protein
MNISMTKFTFVFLAALLPGGVNAQFNYTLSNNAVTITAYYGSGGAVQIPSKINNLPVVSIQHGSFDPYNTGNWANVTSISIPDSVNNIDYYAFQNCNTVTNITFGAGVISIGFDAFVYCGGLMAITADTNNPAFSTVNGILFDKNQTTLIQFPQRKVASDYTIPDSVTNIGRRAFIACAGLTHVTIGNGVISIGMNAFSDCTGLTSLVIPDGVANISEAFSGCTGLTNVTIGSGVTSIDYTFGDCTSLLNVSIPTNVSNIGISAFNSCTNLPAIAIPASVTNIGGYAFYGCTHLGSITIPGSVSSIGADAFYSCLGLTNVTIGNAVASIGDNAFAGCVRLTSVLIPQSVIAIGVTPFIGCSGLKAITVDASNPSYSSVEGVLFDKNQTTLIQWPDGRSGSYILPNSVTNIARGAFGSCVTLTNITIDAGVSSIGDQAFLGCSNLTAVYFEGNAPFCFPKTFGGSKAIAYYLPGTTGWSATLGGIPTALWKPTILTLEPNFGVRTNNFGFSVSWAPNTLVVVVEACTNLASPVWSSVAILALSGGSAYFSDPQWTNYPNRFYRLRSP